MYQIEENILVDITIPNNFTPRDYQIPTFEYFHNGGDRAVDIWPRRAGKDTTALHLLATMMVNRVGNYWHLYPQQNQARKAIWKGINKVGKKILDEVFPMMLRKRTSDQEMTIELWNGSTYQLCGSDRYDSLVGSNPVGVVISEYPLTDPAAWSYIRPILAENEGWAYFIYTPRGRNHGYKLYNQAMENPRWHCSKLTIDDINHISPENMADERAEMEEEEFKQEYYTDFDAVVKGVVYSAQIVKLRNDGRIGAFPYNPSQPVKVIMDIGLNDSTALIFVQTINGQNRIIDCYENNQEQVDHYAKIIKEKPYNYCETPLILPHDSKHKRFGMPTPVDEQFEELGLKSDVLPMGRIVDGISDTRTFLSVCVINEATCGRLIECLEDYKYKWNDKLKILSKEPEHNWSSHMCDAMRYVGVGYVQEEKRNQYEEQQHEQEINDYNPYGEFA